MSWVSSKIYKTLSFICILSILEIKDSDVVSNAIISFPSNKESGDK